MTRILTTMSVALLALADLGCGHCKTPPPFHVTLEADRFSNSAEEGPRAQSFTTRVLVLQLKSLEEMLQAGFDAVRKDPAAVLKTTLVGAPVELSVNPGEVERHWVARDKDAQYVAAVAIFQLPSDSWWASYQLGRVPPHMCRDIAPEAFGDRLPASTEAQMRFYIKGSTISLLPPPDRWSDRAAPSRSGSGS